MGIGNDGPRAFRDNEIAEMRRREHRAFDMHVRVNKRRKNGFSGEIDDFSGFDAARGNKTRDAVTSYEHVDSRKPHAVKNIGRDGPGETKIRQAGGKARVDLSKEALSCQNAEEELLMVQGTAAALCGAGLVIILLI